MRAHRNAAARHSATQSGGRKMRLGRLLALSLVAVAPLALVAGSASAVRIPPRHVVTQWHTCQPQETLIFGIYQFDNDQFAGKRGSSCITVTAGRHSLTIDRNVRAQGGGVVAYPAIRVGAYYYVRDALSGFPLPVRKAHRVLRLDNTGHARGWWLDALDVWFARQGTPATDHIRE